MIDEKEDALVNRNYKVRKVLMEPREKKAKSDYSIDDREITQNIENLGMLEKAITDKCEKDSESDEIDLTKDIYTLDELLKLKETEVPFLVENLIPERTISFLAGDSDTGKSLFYTQLSTAIIEGKSEFLGLKLNTKLKRVLIINSEDGPISIAVRVKKQLSGKLLSTEVSQRLTILTNGSEAAKRIEAILKENPVSLIAIDAFADVLEEDINSSIAVRKFLNMFVLLIQKYGCTVLFVHHIGKGKESMGANKSHMLGSVGIHGKPRNVLMLSKHPNKTNIKTLRIVKGNYVSEEVKNKDLFLEFDPKSLLHKVVEDKSLSDDIATQPMQSPNFVTRKKQKVEALIFQAWRLKDEGYNQDEIAELVGRNKSTVSRWFKKGRPKEYDVSRVIK